jgi:hypothetical protein
VILGRPVPPIVLLPTVAPCQCVATLFWDGSVMSSCGEVDVRLLPEDEGAQTRIQIAGEHELVAEVVLALVGRCSWLSALRRLWRWEEAEHRLQPSELTPHPPTLTREFMNLSHNGHASTPAIGAASGDSSRRISGLFLSMAVLQHRTWAAPERRLLSLQPARCMSPGLLLESMLHRSWSHTERLARETNPQ